MPIEPYDICPCGSGDKIKFCCGIELIPEIESISRSMEGGQFAAAQQQLDKLLESKGNLACLLAMKGITLLATNTGESFIKFINPKNARADCLSNFDCSTDLFFGFTDKATEHSSHIQAD